MPKKKLPRLVQAESETMARWLRRAAKDRSTRPVKDRLDTLLWSWPIRPALSKHPPNPLWTGKKDEEGRATVLTRLTGFAETVYPDMWYPEAMYSMEWAPWNSPSNMHDDDFKNMCHEICQELRRLPGIAVPDPHDDCLWLCTLLEHGWGDRQREWREEMQNSVVNDLSVPMRRQVCEIGERARDAAYHHVRITRSLDAQRRDKDRAKQFKDWLREMPSHAPFVEAHLADRKALSAFATAFQVVKAQRKRVTEIVNAYMNNVFEDEGRDRRARAGRPGRGAWVDPADRALKRLKLSQQERRTLLMAWGLVPLERA
ncbi:MAG TPA: hypothetical protein VGQ08_17035 [Nitrospiraceae bacterium]|jgi:hypothetical protein|nr:hypothetical protein [Nitrospiraceae bacterium]